MNRTAIIRRSARWRKENRDRFNEAAARRYLREKASSIAMYGGSCPCGEKQTEFLTIDHVNDDGAEDRKSWRGKAAHIHAWLKANGYPAGYQVLCGNCNLKKEIERRRKLGSKTWVKNQAAKTDVLSRFGGRCVCCLESDPDKLVMDHVHGGGSEEKKKYPSRNVYLSLRGKEPDRSKFQVLCQNCNQAKASLGTCPHKLTGCARRSGRRPK